MEVFLEIVLLLEYGTDINLTIAYLIDSVHCEAAFFAVNCFFFFPFLVTQNLLLTSCSKFLSKKKKRRTKKLEEPKRLIVLVTFLILGSRTSGKQIKIFNFDLFSNILFYNFYGHSM